jgi:hypothetical protein
MNSANSSVLGQLGEVRKQLADKRDRLRADLTSMGHDPRRLSGDKRNGFATTSLCLRILDDLEAQIFSDALDDVPGTIAQVIALLKQVQKSALPGNATPIHGSQVVPPRRPKHAP